MLKFFEKSRWLSILITLIIAGIIFYLSDLTSLPKIGPVFYSIAYHMVIFSLFTLFLFISIKSSKKIKAWQIIIVLIIAIIYAVLDEVHQYFVPGRHAGLQDVLYDLVGILFIVFSYSLKSSGKHGRLEEKAYHEDVKNTVNGE